MLGGEVPEFFEHNVSHHGAEPQGLRVTSCTCTADVPMKQARALLEAHVDWAYGKFRALGAPHFDVTAHVDRFFGHLKQVLPPNGAYFLAHDGAGQVVGTAALWRLSPVTAEMKHLYVRPDARRKGLGARLIGARIEAARALGIRTLVADTFRGNTPMIRLYHRFGFDDAEAYDSAVAKTSPELIPHLRYFRMDL